VLLDVRRNKIFVSCSDLHPGQTNLFGVKRGGYTIGDLAHNTSCDIELFSIFLNTNGSWQEAGAVSRLVTVPRGT